VRIFSLIGYDPKVSHLYHLTNLQQETTSAAFETQKQKSNRAISVHNFSSMVPISDHRQIEFPLLFSAKDKVVLQLLSAMKDIFRVNKATWRNFHGGTFASKCPDLANIFFCTFKGTISHTRNGVKYC